MWLVVEVIIEGEGRGPVQSLTADLCDCCFFLSTPARLIAGLMEGRNKTAAALSGQKKLKRCFYICVSEEEGECVCVQLT